MFSSFFAGGHHGADSLRRHDHGGRAAGGPLHPGGHQRAPDGHVPPGDDGAPMHQSRGIRWDPLWCGRNRNTISMSVF